MSNVRTQMTNQKAKGEMSNIKAQMANQKAKGKN
jgi:hypothetical protein